METQALERYIEENTKSLKTITGLKRLINELEDRSFYGRIDFWEYVTIKAYLKEELAAKVAAKPVVVKEVVPVTIDERSYTLGGKVFPIKRGRNITTGSFVVIRKVTKVKGVTKVATTKYEVTHDFYQGRHYAWIKVVESEGINRRADWIGQEKCVLISKLYTENIDVILPENCEEITLMKNIRSIENQIEIIHSQDMRLGSRSAASENAVKQLEKEILRKKEELKDLEEKKRKCD